MQVFDGGSGLFHRPSEFPQERVFPDARPAFQDDEVQRVIEVDNLREQILKAVPAVRSREKMRYLRHI